MAAATAANIHSGGVCANCLVSCRRSTSSPLFPHRGRRIAARMTSTIAAALRSNPSRTLLPQRPLAYVCGSSGFTASMTERLIALGMPRFDIFSEAFTSPPPVPAQLLPQTIHVIGAKSFVWSPELGSILDAAQAAGVPLASGCRVGQCESCAMRVVGGSFATLGARRTQRRRRSMPDLSGRTAFRTHTDTRPLGDNEAGLSHQDQQGKRR